MTDRPRFLDEPAPPEPVRAATVRAATVRAATGAEAASKPSGPMLLDPAPDAPTSLQPRWAPQPIATGPDRPGNGFWIGTGVLAAIATWAGVSAASYLVDVVMRPTPLGIAAALGVGGGLAVAGYGLGAEWRDYRRLRIVDATRATLADTETPIALARQAALAWLDRVAPHIGDASTVAQALRDAGSVSEVNAILRTRVAEPLRGAVRRIGQDAAVEGAALVAISPHASWDGLIAAVKGLLVIRKVARLYGLRPGPAVTAALVRKVAWTAAGTAGVDLLSQTLADQALTSLPVARHVLAALPGSGVAALRLYRLAWITAEACSPVPR